MPLPSSARRARRQAERDASVAEACQPQVERREHERRRAAQLVAPFDLGVAHHDLALAEQASRRRRRRPRRRPSLNARHVQVAGGVAAHAEARPVDRQRAGAARRAAASARRPRSRSTAAPAPRAPARRRSARRTGRSAAAGRASRPGSRRRAPAGRCRATWRRRSLRGNVRCRAAPRSAAASTSAAKAKNPPHASTSIARSSRFMVESRPGSHSNLQMPELIQKIGLSRFAQRVLAAHPELAAELADPAPFTRAEMLNALGGSRR